MFADAPCLVIVDVHLPGTDGVAVARTLAADPRTAAVPVLILTADIQGAPSTRMWRSRLRRG